jgi:hypothetical protein
MTAGNSAMRYLPSTFVKNDIATRVLTSRLSIARVRALHFVIRVPKITPPIAKTAVKGDMSFSVYQRNEVRVPVRRAK